MCRKTNPGSFMTNGVKPTVKFHNQWSVATNKRGNSRWYHIPQCSWPTLCNFKLLGRRFRFVREKVYKLLRQKAGDYDAWTVRIIITFLFTSKRAYQNCRFDDNRMGLSISMSRMPYGLSWRRHRKSFHEYFHSNVVTKYLPIQNQATREFLRRLLVRPDDFLEHIRQ